MSAVGEVDRSKLAAKWQRRFAVFDEAGGKFEVKDSPTYKGMEFLERTTVTFNVWAFLFGIIYYFVLGMPKRALGITGCSLFVYMMLYALDMSSGWFRAHSIGTQTIFAVMANYYYYIRVTQGRDEWDPLKDIRQI